MDLIFAVLRDFVIAFVVAVCWGILFGTPKKILLIAGLVGGMGHCIRFILLQLGFGLISATLAGSVAIGLVGIFVAHKVHNPPVVFTMPACITMIPGMFAYRTMLAGIKITDLQSAKLEPDVLLVMTHNFMLTMSLLFTLAIGICIGALLFRKTSVRDISLAKVLEKMSHIQHTKKD
ncbi:threonine/serine exporter family protein [Dysgonomonas sp. 520]|uniref:threonine/serine exporter family protein n=1 Tax=Dysgonomonas sp. 520 TaxID=2302931 RepID=UPI0013D54097|nr:threonine/serine exporter family protein [Dysgonomonas sp. 520]NDW10160.1 threonine/serine exporter [Dysgonomonas sp. 520]